MNNRRLMSLCLLVLCQSAAGGGFQVNPTINSMPRFLAGSGVAGDEIGDVFYNPAGLAVRTVSDEKVNGKRAASKFECEAALLYVRLENDFQNTKSSQSLGAVSGIPSQGHAATSDDDNYVPTQFCAWHSTDKLHFGFGAAPTFGLKNNYDINWIGRYHALKSKLLTINANPAMAYEVNGSLFVGAGVSVEYADAELSQAVFTGPGSQDGHARIDGDDFGFGYNLGVIWQPSLEYNSRIGISFRSKIKHELEGSRRLVGVGISSGKVDAVAKTTLPETVMLSMTTDIPGQTAWSLAATARWTNWSRFDEIRISFEDGSPDDVTPQNWKDSWTLGAAITYRPSAALKFTVGGGFDDSPLRGTEFRNARIPDTDRYFFGFGVIYNTPWAPVTAEFAYHRIFVGSRAIKRRIDIAPGVTDTLVGRFNNQGADVFGARFAIDVNAAWSAMTK